MGGDRVLPYSFICRCRLCNGRTLQKLRDHFCNSFGDFPIKIHSLLYANLETHKMQFSHQVWNVAFRKVCVTLQKLCNFQIEHKRHMEENKVFIFNGVHNKDKISGISESFFSLSIKGRVEWGEFECHRRTFHLQNAKLIQFQFLLLLPLMWCNNRYIVICNVNLSKRVTVSPHFDLKSNDLCISSFLWFVEWKKVLKNYQ